jgi:predicted nucleic acid-binding protein
VIFLDTSVLIAIAQVSHSHHRASRALWNDCTREESRVSAHTLAELYGTLTAMPPALRIGPREIVLAVDTFLKRLTPTALTAGEYVHALARAAQLGLRGGVIYDLLHLECARKCGAERIYTLNVRHFQAAAPDLAERIVMP